LACSAALWWLLSSRRLSEDNHTLTGRLGRAHRRCDELDVGEAVARSFLDAGELLPGMQRALGAIGQRTGIQTLALVRDRAFASSGVSRRLADRARTALLAGDSAESVARLLTSELGATATAVPIRGADGHSAHLVIASARAHDLLASPAVRDIATSLARSIDSLLARRRERQQLAKADLDFVFARRPVNTQKLRVVGGH